MTTIKGIHKPIDGISVDDFVTLHHHTEDDCTYAIRRHKLPTFEENEELLTGPSYHTGSDTIYYVGCGVVTRVFGRTCWVK